MSGEVDTRPDLTKIIREMRDRIRELERRIQGDEAGLDLSDLNDVRVDSMVDGGVVLADGSTLLYRASDKLWYAGAGSGGLPITADDGTNTVTIAETSHDLRLYNTLDAGSVLKSRLILSGDGTAYLEAHDGEVVISSFGGAIQDARLDAGSGDAYCRAQSQGGAKVASLVLDSSLVTEVDDGTYSQPTFHVGRSNTGWATLFETLKIPAPDGDLTTSDFTMWLDDTPGATKINWKAKDSGGTVRTGSVALT